MKKEKNLCYVCEEELKEVYKVNKVNLCKECHEDFIRHGGHDDGSIET